MITLLIIWLTLLIIGIYKFHSKGKDLDEIEFIFAVPLVVTFVMVCGMSIVGFFYLVIKYFP